MRRQLVARLWQANMLEFIDQDPEEHIDIFTVIKKDGPPPPAGSGRQSRLIWDARRLNERCKPPPKMPMGSTTCFSFWDTSEALEEGFELHSFVGDVPDWFYRILLPESIRKFFGIRGATPDLVLDILSELGEAPPPGAVGALGIVLKVLPMGWSWAPFIAHTLMLDIFEKALDSSGSRRVADGHPTPSLSTTTPVHWGYIDDYGAGLLQRIAST